MLGICCGRNILDMGRKMNIDDISKETLFELVIQYKKMIEKQGDEIKTLEKNYQDAMQSVCEYRNELMEERKARRKAKNNES